MATKKGGASANGTAVVPLPRQLQLLADGKRLLAEARTIGDARDIRDKAQAVAHYLRQRDDSGQAALDAAELKLWAERRLGELLRDTVNHQGSKGVGHSVEPTLPAEVGKTDSHRWQRMAGLPEAAFTEYLAEGREAGDLTTAGVLRLARQATREAERHRDPLPEGLPGEGTLEDVLASRARFHIRASDARAFLALVPDVREGLMIYSPFYGDARVIDGLPTLTGEKWAACQADVIQAGLRVVHTVCCVCDGPTKNFRWEPLPHLLGYVLHYERGVNLWHDDAYVREGIPGSGGPDRLKNRFEFVIHATRSGKPPWSDNTAMGHPPVYPPGGEPSHQTQDGTRVNQRKGAATPRRRHGRRERQSYQHPVLANPGNVIDCGSVGGGRMGDELCHQNEGPFAEYLVEYLIKTYCPEGGLVIDCMMGSGTTLAVAVRLGRRAVGCDIRQPQVDLTRERLQGVAVK
jgi:hypothetical protein